MSETKPKVCDGCGKTAADLEPGLDRIERDPASKLILCNQCWFDVNPAKYGYKPK